MGDDAVQIRSKDDEDFNQFCLAENKTVPFKCSEISALLTIPELPTLPEIKSCELTTELVTTELTTFTTEETGKVSVSSPQRTSTGASDPTVSTLTKDSEDKSTNPTTVDGGTLTDTVTSSQQSTSNLDLLSSTTTTPRNEFIATPPSSKNPNAALIIGLTSLGVLFLIVAAVILFYKFYYKPKKSRSLTVTPTSGGSPQEVNGPLRFHDPDKRFLELHPANSLQAGDGKNETKEPHISANDIGGKNSPSVLPPVASSKQVGESDITQPKNKKKKKRKRKSPEAQVLPNVESPVIGNGTGEPKEVIT